MPRVTALRAANTNARRLQMQSAGRRAGGRGERISTHASE